MADSIKEKISKNAKTTLEGITVTNGYNNTIQSVQRYLVGGQAGSESPYIIMVQGDELITGDAPDQLVSKEFEIHCDVIARIDVDVDFRSGDEVMNSLTLDIEKALQIDPQRGGNAVDTMPVEVLPLAVEAGSHEVNSVVSFKVQYRQRRSDPALI